jgi:hypothetical protein
LLKEMVGRFHLKNEVNSGTVRVEPNKKVARTLPATKPVISLGKGDFGKY